MVLISRKGKGASNIYDLLNTFKKNPEDENTAWTERQEASITIRERLDEARLKEIYLKNKLRILTSVFTAVLLVCQNVLVFWIVIRALNDGSLKDLQLIFATLVSATLTETYFIMKIIVQFVFSSIDYNYEKK